MARKGNPISVRLDLNRSSDSSRFSDIFASILTFISSLIKRFIFSITLLFITRLLWDWGFTWVAPLVGVFWGWLDLLLSYVEGFPLSVGGGGRDAGPSRRPLPDLNQPPAPEPELQPEPASSSELREAREEEERLRAWADSESYGQLTERLRQERIRAWGGEAECQRRDAADLIRLRNRTLDDLEREYGETRARVEVLRRAFHMRERQKK